MAKAAAKKFTDESAEVPGVSEEQVASMLPVMELLQSLRDERNGHLKELNSRQMRGHLDESLTSADGVHRQTVEIAHQTRLLEAGVGLLYKILDEIGKKSK